MNERPGAYGRNSTFFPADYRALTRHYQPETVDEYHLQACTGCRFCLDEELFQ